MKISVKKIGARWQPVTSAGHVVRGDVYNADGRGYSTKEGATEATQMLRSSSPRSHAPQRAHATRGAASGARAGFAGPAVTISVHADADEETGDETYTVSDDGGEFDDAEEESLPDVQANVDERLHYRTIGRRVELQAPGRLDLR